MAAVLFGGQISVADLEHIRVVPVALAGIFEEIDIDFVYAENRLPVRLDIGRRAPKVACRRAPAPRKVSAPLADGIDYRALLGAVSVGIFGGCTHELSAHLSILDSRAVLSRSDGVFKLDCVRARFERYLHLMSAVSSEALGRRHGGSILILAVDGNFEIFEAVALLSDSEGE